MAPIHSSYIVPFNPQGAPGPTILTTMTPYPDLANIYRRLAISDPGDDMFEDLYLSDL